LRIAGSPLPRPLLQFAEQQAGRRRNQPEHRAAGRGCRRSAAHGPKAAEMAQTRMRTTRPVILSCSRHATQAARELGSDLVDYWWHITIKTPKCPDRYLDPTRNSAKNRNDLADRNAFVVANDLSFRAASALGVNASALSHSMRQRRNASGKSISLRVF
jgi:hypothetical protein